MQSSCVWLAGSADVVVNDVQVATEQRSAGHDLVREVELLGQAAMGIEVDVSDATEVQNMVNRVVERFGHIDILVNNAAS